MDATMHWEQDGKGGTNGTAIYYFMDGSITLGLESFAKAHELNEALILERKNIAREARKNLLVDIARIKA
jgi:hypothetical protein